MLCGAIRREEKNGRKDQDQSENIMPLCRSPVQSTLAPEGTYAGLRRVSAGRWIARGLGGAYHTIQRGGAASSGLVTWGWGVPSSLSSSPSLSRASFPDCK